MKEKELKNLGLVEKKISVDGKAFCIYIDKEDDGNFDYKINQCISKQAEKMAEEKLVQIISKKVRQFIS